MKKLIRFIATKGGFATLAILTGLSSPIGLAMAAGTIGSLDIINGQVKTVDLAKGAVTSAKIKAGAVDSAKIAEGTIVNADIAAGAAIAASKINRTGLDADLLDGQSASAFAGAGHNHDAAYVNDNAAEVGDADIADGAISAAKIAGTAWTSTNDGAGSGLDADQLDGREAGAFSLAGHDHDAAYVNDDAGEVDDADIAKGGLSAAMITGTAWTSANDGKDSGLDADQLDGLEAADFSFAGHAHDAADINSGTLGAARLPVDGYNGTYFTEAESGANFVNDNAGEVGDADIADGAISAAKIAGMAWTSTNDGAGSGLDADKLDGLEAADFPQRPKLTASQIAMFKWYEAGKSAYTVGAAPEGIVFDGANIWTANGVGTVTKLNAATGALVGTYNVGAGARGIAFDGANIWTTNFSSNTVTKLNAATGALVGTYNVGAAPYGIAFDGANIWTTNNSSSTVTKLNAATGALVGTYNVLAGPRGIAFDGTNIWAANNGSSNVTKLTAATGALVGNYAVGLAPGGIAFDGVNMWTANYGGTVTKLNAATGALVGTYNVDAGARGIAFDGVNIWTANGAGTVTKLNAASGALMGAYTVGAAPYGIVFDGANIWTANYGSNNVTMLTAWNR